MEEKDKKVLNKLKKFEKCSYLQKDIRIFVAKHLEYQDLEQINKTFINLDHRGTGIIHISDLE